MKVLPVLFLYLLPWALPAAPVPYSGKVSVNGVNFDGNALFTFTLRDSNGTVHWRNADANGSINVPVDRGNYIIFLGGQGMKPFPNNLFLDHRELYLQVRFYQSDTQEWFHMLPDQRITSVPHALAAEVANLANVAKAVEPGAVTKSMLSAEVLADLNQTVNNAAIASNANIAFSKLAINKADIIGLGLPSSDTDTNLSEAAVDSMVANNGFLSADSITRQMLPGDVLADLNATIPRSRLAADVLSDLNRTIHLSDLAPGVLADLNATITRSRLAADVLADLDHSIVAGSVTRDMLAADVRADLNASLSSASVTAANMHPDLVKYFLPEISNHPVGVSVLQGMGTTLSSEATGKFLTYQWQRNGVDLSGETNATLVLSSVNAGNDGNYSVVVSNDWGGVTSNSATFTVATNSPIITLLGADSVIHEAATSYTDAGATALDALDGNLTASIVVAGHDFNDTASGDHNVTYNVSDVGGNPAVEKVRTVTVVDTTAPVITLIGDANVSHALNTSWNDPGATAIDTLDGNLSNHVTVLGSVDVNATGVNVLTYSVSDAAGNTATNVSRTVNVAAVPSGPWNFTNAGASGRLGPSQAQVDASYSSSNSTLAGKVTINTQGIQEWTVPATGIYAIEAWGAKGGGENGGKGAKITGNLALSAGSVVRLLVGQMGEQTAQGSGSGAGYGAGGGGGTFVYLSPNQPLIIAGGGGGQAQAGNGGQGSATAVCINSTGGTGNGAGGTNGGGGAGGLNLSSYSTGGGGAGWLSNGANGLNLRNPEGKGGESPTNGGKGGEFTHQTSSYTSGNAGDGGFGGGGGMSDNSGAGGGGGGYNGGGGGNNYSSSTWGAGGGGGSFNGGTNQSNIAGSNAGQGMVTIIWVGN